MISHTNKHRKAMIKVFVVIIIIVLLFSVIGIVAVYLNGPAPQIVSQPVANPTYNPSQNYSPPGNTPQEGTSIPSDTGVTDENNQGENSEGETALPAPGEYEIIIDNGSDQDAPNNNTLDQGGGNDENNEIPEERGTGDDELQAGVEGQVEVGKNTDEDLE